MGALTRAPVGRGQTEGEASPRQAVTLVWIDSREAIVLRWLDHAARAVRIRSDVPAHHKSTGHVRHEPRFRHGGGGVAQTAGDPRRLEHLERFLASVMDRVPTNDDLILLGPGTVHEQLAREIRDRDAEHRTGRDVRCEAAQPLTRAQLTARLRRAMGDEPRRRTVGAYRWSDVPDAARFERSMGIPRRVGVGHRPVREHPPRED